MILPDKIIQPCQSLFYIGSLVVRSIENGNNEIDKIFRNICNEMNNNLEYNRYLLTLDYLFTINMVEYSSEVDKLNMHKS